MINGIPDAPAVPVVLDLMEWEFPIDGLPS
jgi:hypothetical protein